MMDQKHNDKLEPPPRPAEYDKLVALVLQGGGALGSYQAGVYEALCGSEYEPDWVAGISIGAINAAIIVGNAPERRVEQLRKFWEDVTAWTSNWWATGAEPFDALFRQAAANSAMFYGEPGFFKPWPPFAFASGSGPISYYDTAALKTTLERLVDFDRINARTMRLSVGAVNLHSGNFRYFDNAEMKLGPEHVMASAALPPAFPPIEIDGEFYWDGGLVSNTPLEYVLGYYPRRSRLTFQVDVFPANGALPTSLEEVSEREKDIRYSSRTRKGTDSFKEMHDIRVNLMTLLEKLPQELMQAPEAQFLDAIACVTRMDIAQLIYRPSAPQGFYKDYEFSRRTMKERWAIGRADAEATLLASPWLAPMSPEVAVRTFDTLGEALKGPNSAAERDPMV
jgi:NTE family protein